MKHCVIYRICTYNVKKKNNKGNESERMKSRHLEEKQTLGRQGVATQKKEAANVIRRTPSKAGGAQLSNAC
jgi:hypothetical protein